MQKMYKFETKIPKLSVAPLQAVPNWRCQPPATVNILMVPLLESTARWSLLSRWDSAMCLESWLCHWVWPVNFAYVCKCVCLWVKFDFTDIRGTFWDIFICSIYTCYCWQHSCVHAFACCGIITKSIEWELVVLWHYFVVSFLWTHCK